EKPRILSWISPLESWGRHSDVSRARAEGVGQWILQSGEFKAWRRGGNNQFVGRILFCHEVPGAGKTFICSLVIDRLCDETTCSNIAVGCLYCDYRELKKQTTEVMIGSLQRQFVTGLPEIEEVIAEAFQTAQSHLGGRPPMFSKIIELFHAVSRHYQKVFICVGALGEYVEDRSGFLGSLRQILDESPNIRLFLIGRYYIELELQHYISLAVNIITIQPGFNDIGSNLTAKLARDRYPGAMDESLRSEIFTKIARESSEI
ncbi:hypothetical protein L873DRAFT_1695037, partial [Choiromyces venosus 120613-1]